MAGNNEFADILREKMGEPTPRPVIVEPNHSFKERYFEPVVPIFTSQRTWIPTHGKMAYPRKIHKSKESHYTPNKTPKDDTPKTKLSIETLFIREQLSKTAIHALDQLQALGAKVAPEFTLSQIKTEYRHLLKKYHPDYFKGPRTYFDKTLSAYRSLTFELSSIPAETP